MKQDIEWNALPGAGSDRVYSRSVGPLDGRSVIRVQSPDVKENKTFIALARTFREQGVRVPEIYEASDDLTTYYIEDLGSVDLFSLLGTADFEPLAAEALRRLARMQTVPEEAWAGSVMHPAFSERQAMFDLNYFKYCFLKPSGVAFDEERLEDEFERLARSLADVPEEETGFMFRDFQSRNIMIPDGEPYFIDFQGGRKGPLLYDVVSFLWQAKAALPDDMKERLLGVYLGEFERLRGVPATRLLQRYADLVLFRTLQVLGAYGMRGLTQRRAHFLQSIAGGLKNIRNLIDKGVLDAYPELKKACESLCSQERFEEAGSGDGVLKVRVFSFSYKKGYPDDFSGNGGGFMFDCRAMHNPGRYAEYKALTGRDEAVIRFLEERGEVAPFLKAASELVFSAVERYLKRGFTSLQVGFGCTGGQHRSVYCAEHMARAIKERFPEAAVELIHREQKIRELL